MLICAINTIFFYPHFIGTVLKDTAPGILTYILGLLVKIWRRLSRKWSAARPGLLGAHAFGFHAVARVVGCRVCLVEITSSGYGPNLLLPSFWAKIYSFMLRRNFGARRYARRCAKILVQSARYAGHVDGVVIFFSLAPYYRFQDNSLYHRSSHNCFRPN